MRLVLSPFATTCKRAFLLDDLEWITVLEQSLHLVFGKACVKKIYPWNSGKYFRKTCSLLAKPPRILNPWRFYPKLLIITF